MRRVQLFPVVVLVLLLAGIQLIAADTESAAATTRPANRTSSPSATKNALVISTSNGSVQVYPPNVQPTDPCEDANWKRWMLFRTPPKFDPFNWDRSQWREYVTKYAIRAAILSLAFLIIGLGALLFALVWRLVQWCVGCGHCQRVCAVGSQDTRFLRDTKHRYLKAWTYVMIAGALGMVVWGMLALDRQLMASFWDAFSDVMDYGSSVNNNLQQIQASLTETAPLGLLNMSQVVNSTINVTQLGDLVQASVDFSSVLTPINSVRTSADSFNLAVGQAMAGFATLAAQFEMPGGSGANGRASVIQRRRIAESATPFDTVSDLLAVFELSLPILEDVDGVRAAIHDQLQTLKDKLTAVQSAASLTSNSREVVDLRSALEAIDLADWDAQLSNIASGLQACNASRAGSAVITTKQAADHVLGASANLTSATVDAIHSQRAQAAVQLGNAAAFVAMKALRLQLANISRDVTDVSSWVVQLRNGTEMGVLQLSNLLVGGLSDFIANDTSIGLATTANVSRTQLTNVTAFVRAARSITSLAPNLTATAEDMLTAIAAVQTAAAGGPDLTPAATRVSSVLRPALADLTTDIDDVWVALEDFESDPSSSNAAGLRSAAGRVAAAVGSAVSTFTAPLPSMATVVNNLQPAVEDLRRLAWSFVSSQASTVTKLQAQGSEVARYQAGLGLIMDLMGELPSRADARSAIMAVAVSIQNKMAEAVVAVRGSLRSVGEGMKAAASEIQSEVLDRGKDLTADYQTRSEDVNKLAYPVAMGAWGLGALLLLLLALSVHLNWPAGLVWSGMALMVYLVLTQIVTSVVSLGLGVLHDSCNNAELVMMRQLVEHSNKSQVAVAFSYYLYKVPTSSAVMLQAAFDLNVSDVRLQLSSLNQTLEDRIVSDFPLRGRTAVLADGLRTLVANSRAMFESTLYQLRHEAFNPLYLNVKGMACCEAGNFAFHEWCALTALAALSFGALISAAYMLARMDMVRQREDSCCSCCSCACYRHEDDEEAQQEDQFVQEAKKRHQMQGMPSNPLYSSASGHKTESESGRKPSNKSQGAPSPRPSGGAKAKKSASHVDSYAPPRSRSMKYGIDRTSEVRQDSPRKQGSARF